MHEWSIRFELHKNKNKKLFGLQLCLFIKGIQIGLFLIGKNRDGVIGKSIYYVIYFWEIISCINVLLGSTELFFSEREKISKKNEFFYILFSNE